MRLPNAAPTALRDPRAISQPDRATPFDARDLRAQPTARSTEPDKRDSATISDAARELSEGEEQMVRELEARDREVKAHEQAHKAAAGNLAAGGPTYTYQVGPDGKRYAIGGEVKIRLQTGRTPEETLRNAERARRCGAAEVCKRRCKSRPR